MRRIAVLILMLCLVRFVCRADGTSDDVWAGKGDDYKVEVLGKILPESLVLRLVERATGDTVLMISLKDLSKLNDEGVIVYPAIYDLVCSYIGEEGSTLSVRIMAFSKGLSSDNGKTFPIGLSFIQPFGDETEIDWKDTVVAMRDTAASRLVRSFRLQLRNSKAESIEAGAYTGTIDFQLTAE